MYLQLSQLDIFYIVCGPHTLFTRIHVLYSVLLLVSVSSENDYVQLHLSAQKIEDSFSIEQNCTTRQELIIPSVVFSMNNVTLAYISRFNETCYINRRKCQQFECECGSQFFFFITMITFPLNVKQSIFSCEIRFKKRKREYIAHIAATASVLYNSSGKLLLNRS